MGPKQYAQHLTSGSRLPFTVAYFGTIALTMYFAVGVSSAFLIRDKTVPFLAIYGPSTEVNGVRPQLHHVRHSLNSC
jgi:hypothetical protein